MRGSVTKSQQLQHASQQWQHLLESATTRINNYPNQQLLESANFPSQQLPGSATTWVSNDPRVSNFLSHQLSESATTRVSNSPSQHLPESAITRVNNYPSQQVPESEITWVSNFLSQQPPKSVTTRQQTTGQWWGNSIPWQLHYGVGWGGVRWAIIRYIVLWVGWGVTFHCLPTQPFLSSSLYHSSIHLSCQLSPSKVADSALSYLVTQPFFCCHLSCSPILPRFPPIESFLGFRLIPSSLCHSSMHFSCWLSPFLGAASILPLLPLIHSSKLPTLTCLSNLFLLTKSDPS